MVYDCLIVGGGPAGLSAALQCGALGLSALLVRGPSEDAPLGRAERVDNYLGLPGLTGAALLERFARHVDALEAAVVVRGRVLNALAYGGGFSLNVGGQIYQGRSVILATGVHRGQPYPGEERLLGRGVSYCATCDGMLYRGRAVAVVGLAQDAPEEAAFLAGLGCQVTYVYVAPEERPVALAADFRAIKAKRLEILGEERVTGLRADGQVLPCQGVFLLRDTVAPTALFPDLAIQDGHIRVSRHMETNLPGVFACGDCAGPPLQIAKAVGEGQMAAHSAGQWLRARENEIQKGDG